MKSLSPVCLESHPSHPQTWICGLPANLHLGMTGCDDSKVNCWALETIGGAGSTWLHLTEASRPPGKPQQKPREMWLVYTHRHTMLSEASWSCRASGSSVRNSLTEGGQRLRIFTALHLWRNVMQKSQSSFDLIGLTYFDLNALDALP